MSNEKLTKIAVEIHNRAMRRAYDAVWQEEAGRQWKDLGFNVKKQPLKLAEGSKADQILEDQLFKHYFNNHKKRFLKVLRPLIKKSIDKTLESNKLKQ